MLIKLQKTFCGQQSPIRQKCTQFTFYQNWYIRSNRTFSVLFTRVLPKIYLQLVREIPLQTYSEIYLSMPPKNLGPKYPLKILDQEKDFTSFFPVPYFGFLSKSRVKHFLPYVYIVQTRNDKKCMNFSTTVTLSLQRNTGALCILNQ